MGHGMVDMRAEIVNIPSQNGPKPEAGLAISTGRLAGTFGRTVSHGDERPLRRKRHPRADSPVVIVAGFMATVEQWDAYERDLKALFDDYGVKKFHAKDLRGRKGDFKGWPTKEARDLYLQISQAWDDHLACGFATVLISDSYHQIYRNGRFSEPHDLTLNMGCASAPPLEVNFVHEGA